MLPPLASPMHGLYPSSITGGWRVWICQGPELTLGSFAASASDSQSPSSGKWVHSWPTGAFVCHHLPYPAWSDPGQDQPLEHFGFEVEVTAKGVSSPQAGVPLPPLGAWQSRLLRRNFLAGSSLLSWGPGRTLLTTIGAGGQGRGRVLGAARGSGSLHSPALEGLQVPPQGAASPLP